MIPSRLASLVAALVLAPAIGCSSAGSGGTAPRGAGGAGGGGGSDGGLLGGEDGGPIVVDPPCESTDPNADVDGDGFTPAQGDCNDCSALMNPGGYDFPADDADEDCNGTVDDEPAECDANLAEGADDALDAARALGICRMQAGASWGLVSAKWVFPDGSTHSTGDPGDGTGEGCSAAMPPNAASRAILGAFGDVVKPREGHSLLSLSTGVARPGIIAVTPPGSSTSPGTEGGFMCTSSATPPGFPKDSPSCPGVTTAQEHVANDGTALEIVVKTPTNAKTVSFDFDFFTFEWPMFVCDKYNDFFVALLSSQSPTTPADKNISFDSQGNTVSVNSGMLDVCWGAYDANGRKFPCKLGPGELAGTGFDQKGPQGNFQSASTSWLRTTAGVVPGETITLRFAIWDGHDEHLDSTVLVDHFGWDLEEGSVATLPAAH